MGVGLIDGIPVVPGAILGDPVLGEAEGRKVAGEAVEGAQVTGEELDGARVGDEVN